MKRMKNLLALVMAVVMVLALAIPAFAANGGKITVANDDAKWEYTIYKVFNASLDDGEYTYTNTNASLKTAIERAKTDDLTTSGFPDIIIDATTGKVTKTDTFSAADFAKWLAANKTTAGLTPYVYTEGSTSTTYEDMEQPNGGFPVNDDGYYFITYENGQPFALTTVDSGKTVQIQNKHDTPFDKDVYKASAERTARDPSHNEKSVQLGDTLYYQITGKVVNAGTNTQYNYLVWDKLSKGQSLNFQNSSTTYADTVKVWLQPLDANGAPTGTTRYDITNRFTVDTHSATPVTSTPKDTIWVNTTVPANADAEVYTDTKPTFVVNIDMKALDEYILADATDGGLEQANLNFAILIEYSATVLEDVGVIDNTAHLVSNDLIKDAQTQNYVSEIVVDKFETGNALQKLQGAEFVLYKVATAADVTAGNAAAAGNLLFYRLLNNDVEWIDSGETALADVDFDTNAKTDPTDNGTDFTKVVTTTDGSAHFVGLADGTYKLYEIKAPDGYVRLETPVDVTVNGKASLDPNNVVDNNPTDTAKNQKIQLQNVSHVGNTPGSVLPSTGGRGTTMLYMAGLGMMLAAGAFLIFRRRAEAGK